MHLRLTHKDVTRAILLTGLGLSFFVLIWLALRRPGWGPDILESHLPGVPAHVHAYDLGDLVRVGPKRLVVIRFLGPVELRPITYGQAGLKAPAPVAAWADKLDVPIVFNAGQFDINRRYLGWLKGAGFWLSESRKLGWQGLLVTKPTYDAEDVAFGEIIDLNEMSRSEAQRVANSYDNVVQSMMLLDDAQEVRVRRTDKAACRTVVAQDDEGHLLLLASEGAITLYDLAQWLKQSGLRIKRAMNLDGGVESQLAIRTPELSLTLYGKYGTESQIVGPRTGGAEAPLPMVVAVFPRIFAPR